MESSTIRRSTAVSTRFCTRHNEPSTFCNEGPALPAHSGRGNTRSARPRAGSGSAPQKPFTCVSLALRAPIRPGDAFLDQIGTNGSASRSETSCLQAREPIRAMGPVMSTESQKAVSNSWRGPTMPTRTLGCNVALSKPNSAPADSEDGRMSGRAS